LSESVRTSKRKRNEHEVGGRNDRVGVRVERIKNKMRRSLSPGWGRAKRGTCRLKGSGKWEFTGAKRKVYSWFVARARGLNSISFFLLLIGLKGYKLI
jgi:hypothetical protein